MQTVGQSEFYPPLLPGENAEEIHKCPSLQGIARNLCTMKKLYTSSQSLLQQLHPGAYHIKIMFSVPPHHYAQDAGPGGILENPACTRCKWKLAGSC